MHANTGVEASTNLPLGERLLSLSNIYTVKRKVCMTPCGVHMETNKVCSTHLRPYMHTSSHLRFYSVRLGLGLEVAIFLENNASKNKS